MFFFIIGETKIMDFHHPPNSTVALTTPLPKRPPRLRSSFVKKCVIRLGLVKIAYNRLATFDCPKKLLGKNHRGRELKRKTGWI